jgi:MATE family multidrug resistance protein
MLLSALVLLLTNDFIASMYTRDLAVRDLAASLLLMAALFQLSDGLQVGAAGALRGYKDTSAPLLVCLVAYWFVGFPLASVLGVARELGAVYVWVGMIAGLTVAAVLLNWRYWWLSARVVRDAQGSTVQMSAA